MNFTGAKGIIRFLYVLTLMILVAPLISYGSPEIATVNQDYTIFATLVIEGSFPTSTINANISIYYSNGTTLIDNQAMTSLKNGAYKYTLTPNQTGEYLVEVLFLNTTNDIVEIGTGTLLVTEDQTEKMTAIGIIFGLISLIAFVLYTSWAVKVDKDSSVHRAFGRVWFLFALIPLNFLTFAMMEFSSGASYHAAFVTLFNIGWIGSVLFAMIMFVLFFVKGNTEMVQNSVQLAKDKFK